MHSVSLMQQGQLYKLTGTAAVHVGAAEERQLSSFFRCMLGALLFTNPKCNSVHDADADSGQAQASHSKSMGLTEKALFTNKKSCISIENNKTWQR